MSQSSFFDGTNFKLFVQDENINWASDHCDLPTMNTRFRSVWKLKTAVMPKECK